MSFIRAELRFKNASLYNSIKSMGLSFPEFAEMVGIDYNSIIGYINFKKYPSKERMEKICEFLGESKQDIFLKYHAQYQTNVDNTIKWDISEPKFKVIQSHTNMKLLSSDFKTDLDRVLKTLTPREEEVIRMFYIEEMDTEQIGEELDLTRNRVNIIKEKAIRRLKCTLRNRLLKDYI